MALCPIRLSRFGSVPVPGAEQLLAGLVFRRERAAASGRGRRPCFVLRSLQSDSPVQTLVCVRAQRKGSLGVDLLWLDHCR